MFDHDSIFTGMCIFAGVVIAIVFGIGFLIGCLF